MSETGVLQSVRQCKHYALWKLFIIQCDVTFNLWLEFCSSFMVHTHSSTHHPQPIPQGQSLSPPWLCKVCPISTHTSCHHSHPIPAKVNREHILTSTTIELYTTDNYHIDYFALHVHCHITFGQIAHCSHQDTQLIVQL